MSTLLLLLVLDLALIVAAVPFLLLVILRKGNTGRNLTLAVFLIALAAGLWYTSIRTPPALP